MEGLWRAGLVGIAEGLKSSAAVTSSRVPAQSFVLLIRSKIVQSNVAATPFKPTGTCTNVSSRDSLESGRNLQVELGPQL